MSTEIDQQRTQPGSADSQCVLQLNQLPGCVQALTWNCSSGMLAIGLSSVVVIAYPRVANGTIQYDVDRIKLPLDNSSNSNEKHFQLAKQMPAKPRCIRFSPLGAGSCRSLMVSILTNHSRCYFYSCFSTPGSISSLGNAHELFKIQKDKNICCTDWSEIISSSEDRWGSSLFCIALSDGSLLIEKRVRDAWKDVATLSLSNDCINVVKWIYTNESSTILAAHSENTLSIAKFGMKDEGTSQKFELIDSSEDPPQERLLELVTIPLSKHLFVVAFYSAHVLAIRISKKNQQVEQKNWSQHLILPSSLYITASFMNENKIGLTILQSDGRTTFYILDTDSLAVVIDHNTAKSHNHTLLRCFREIMKTESNTANLFRPCGMLSIYEMYNMVLFSSDQVIRHTAPAMERSYLAICDLGNEESVRDIVQKSLDENIGFPRSFQMRLLISESGKIFEPEANLLSKILKKEHMFDDKSILEKALYLDSDIDKIRIAFLSEAVQIFDFSSDASNKTKSEHLRKSKHLGALRLVYRMFMIKLLVNSLNQHKPSKKHHSNARNTDDKTCLLITNLIASLKLNSNEYVAKQSKQLETALGKTWKPLPENCSLCGLKIPYTSDDYAKCNNGHIFERCSLTMLASSNVKDSRCVTCGLLRIFNVIERTGDSNLQMLFDAIEICFYCSGMFTRG